MAMNLMEYADRDATNLLQLLHTQDITSHDVLECAYSAIDTLNPCLNAVVQVFERNCPPMPAYSFAGAPTFGQGSGAGPSTGTLSQMGVPIVPPIRPPRMLHSSHGLRRSA